MCIWNARNATRMAAAVCATILSGTLTASAVDKSAVYPKIAQAKTSSTSANKTVPAKFKELVDKGAAAKTQGQYRDAERYLKEAIDAGQASGVTRDLMLVPLNDLAGTYRHLNKLTEAEATYKDVLKLLTELNATASIGYATVLDNLAQVYSLQGDLQQCEKMQKEAIAIYSKSSDVRAKNEKAIAMANLAQTYVDEKKYGEAESAFKEALAVFEEIAPESPQIAILYDNYAGLYRKQEKPIEALVLQEKALKLLEKGLGKGHPEVAIALVNISQTYFTLGRNPEAEQALKRSLEINERVFGASSEQTADTLYKLIKFYKVTGRPSDAKQFEARLMQSGTAPVRNSPVPIPHKP